jgi:hypothetical protein
LSSTGLIGGRAIGLLQRQARRAKFRLSQES